MGKGSAYYALDISSDSIAAVKAVVNRQGKITEIVCQSGKSAGIKNGVVTELGLCARSISDVLGKLSALSGSNIKSLYVSLQYPYAKAHHSFCTIPLSGRLNKIITSADIIKANQQAYSLGLNIEEQVLHHIPQEYTIDNHNKVIDPHGLYGHKLSADLLLITALGRDMQNLLSAIDQAGYKSRAIVLSCLATSLAVLNEETKKNGCSLLDIGFDFSQMAVFKDGIVRGYETFDFGWRHIIEAVANELKLPYALAEDVASSAGAAVATHISREQEVLVKREQSYRPIKRRFICSIIENKLQDLYLPLKERMAVYLKAFELPHAVMVSGKAALLEGFIESLDLNLGISARLAKIEDAPANDLMYTTAIGLVKYAVSLHPRMHLFALSSYGNMFQKITLKAKEIYHEYF